MNLVARTTKRLSLSRWLVVYASLAIGCLPSDPGWSYQSRNGKRITSDGVKYELPISSGVRPRVHASLFAGTLSVELDLLVEAGASAEVNMRGLTVRDKAGHELRRRVIPTMSCGGQRQGDACTLTSGQSCRLAAGFSAKPFDSGLGTILQRRNTDLSEITVFLTPSLRTPDGEAELKIALEWD
jgi:hypothetical protein